MKGIALGLALLAACGEARAADDLLTAPLARQQAAMVSGQASAESLASAYLARIEALNHKGPRLNAVIAVSPAALSRRTRGASPLGTLAERAREPAVAGSPAVSMLSLSRIAAPCSGPARPALRSPSRARASARAAGLTAITAFRRGPLWLSASIRAR